MSLTTDNVRASPLPNVWRIGPLTVAGVVIGACELVFCVALFAFGKFKLRLDLDALRTLATILLIFSGEATLYAIRTRRHLWSIKPSRWVVVSTVGDILIISLLAIRGIAMHPVPLALLAGALGASVIFAFVLDAVKIPLFQGLKIA
jgi:H+-transporting ATPase